MRKLLVTFSLILALFGSSIIVNAAVQEGTVNISSTLDGEVLTNGSDSQIDIGSVLDLDATTIGDDNVFAFWIVNGFVRTDLPAVTQLRVQSKMNLVAVFRSADKHAVLFVDSNGKLIDDVYVADGETITAPSTEGLTKPGGLTVVADEANRWISLEGNTSLVGINSSRVYVLQYEMPATSVDIMAIGALTEEFTANKNDVVTVVAADTANFKYWADEDGNVLSYNSTYSFTALEEVIIEAESETVKAAESFVVMQDLTGIRSGHVSYMGRYELHGGDELVEFGFIYGNTIGDIEMGMPNVDVAISNVANPATNEFLMSFVNEHHVTARAYAIVKNGEAIRTIYSDLVVKPNVQEIEDIRTTSGAVTSYGIVSGIMGTKYVFVQQKDGSAGIVLYNATIPAALAVGDEVIIRGTMGEFRGLVQITSGTFEILNSGNTVPLAEDTVTSLSSLAIADQGRRFSIDGLTVVSASGQNLVVKDASNNEITIRVDQTSYTDLMDFVASLVPGEVINLVDMHLIWYDGAQFSFNSLSEIVKNAEGTEDSIKSILTSLNGSEYNENTTVALPDTIAGVAVSWSYPDGLVSDGKFTLVDEDTNFDLTATFTVPGRTEVTQQVTINIKDVPEGTAEPVVLLTSDFGATNDSKTNYGNYFQDSVVNVGGGTSTYYRAGGNYNSGWDFIGLGQKSVAARLGDMVSNSTLNSAVDSSDPNVMVATGFKLGNVTSIVISMPKLKAGTTVYLQSSIDGVNWTSVDSLAPSAISSLTDISFSNINISGEVFFRIIFENSNPTSSNRWLGEIKTISFWGVNPA